MSANQDSWPGNGATQFRQIDPVKMIHHDLAFYQTNQPVGPFISNCEISSNLFTLLLANKPCDEALKALLSDSGIRLSRPFIC